MKSQSQSYSALVTGGARGIGLGISTALAQAGYDLAIIGARPENLVVDTLTALRQAGVAVTYAQCDIADRNAREKALEKLWQELGPINFLVNNAGMAPRVRADILDATEESFVEVMRTNLQGPYFLTQSFARRLLAARQSNPELAGAIVNISSISATTASVSRGEYCLSKAGVSMATRLWAARLGEYNIPVYEIQPGIIQTDMTAAVTEKYDRLIQDGLCLQARWGLPEDIGRAVLMLLRGDLAYSTGQVIMIDGGMNIPRL